MELVHQLGVHGQVLVDIAKHLLEDQQVTGKSLSVGKHLAVEAVKLDYLPVVDGLDAGVCLHHTSFEQSVEQFDINLSLLVGKALVIVQKILVHIRNAWSFVVVASLGLLLLELVFDEVTLISFFCVHHLDCFKLLIFKSK